MNRSDRRRLEKEFKKVLSTAGDCCGLCGKALEHNSKTFGGFVTGSQITLAGECCVNKMVSVMASGVYVTENIDSIPRIKPNIKSSHVTQEGVATAIASIQSHFTTLDKMSDRVMRQAGIKGQPNNVYLGEIPWKADDSDWFKAHPNRSHRMRPIYSGEAVTLSKELIIPPPLENHRYEILVRQVEVGKRIRTVFCRNTKAYIPDEEEVIHAIFDIVSRSGTTGVLTFNEVEALAVRYNISLSAKPH